MRRKTKGLGARARSTRPIQRPRPHAAALVVPTQIPWDQLTGPALEELIYWLCDAMGGKDLEWRAGAAQGTSRDRGRDVEVTFYVSEPGGGLRPERWWVQAKGRSATVRPGDVREAAINGASRSDLGVLVVATNSRFSNDTRDWVREYQQGHPRPVIKLWDRSELERMLVEQPSVVARVAPQALSPQGRLAALNASFWNWTRFATSGDLKAVWADRSRLRFTAMDWVACLASEGASDDFLHRPWGAEIPKSDLAEVLVVALASAPGLAMRMEQNGVSSRAYIDGLGNLLASAILRLEAHVVSAVLDDPWAFVKDGPKWPKGARPVFDKYIFLPVIARLIDFYGSACAADCVRVSGLVDEPEVKPASRWGTLAPHERVSVSERVKAPRGRLIVEKLDAPCNAGLNLNNERTCPFVHWEEWSRPVLVGVLQIVLQNRLAQLRASSKGSRPIRG
jgi:hypothetical protein